MADIQSSAIPLDVHRFLETNAVVVPRYGAIPSAIYERLQPQLLQGAARARAYVREKLDTTGQQNKN